jgi:DNA-binding IclR family transcriptional regulator
VVEAKPDNVSRAAAALVALGEPEALGGGGLGVARLAELTGGDKGQVSRLLATLLEHGLVERDTETQRYRLGWQLFALAAQVGDQRLLGIAGPLLAALVDRVGERASLSVLRGPDVLTVSSRSPQRAVQTIGWVGRTVPSYCTSSGRALLLDHRREGLVELFARTRFDPLGPNSPRDVDALQRRIRTSRARGFAVVTEEFAPELVAVAAPVRDARGEICAAVNVSAPKFRLGGARRLIPLGAAIKEVADEMSALLAAGADPSATGGPAATGRRPRPRDAAPPAAPARAGPP